MLEKEISESIKRMLKDESVKKRLNDKRYEVVECWKEQISLLSENLEDTKDYILNKCNDRNFRFLSKIFVDLIEKTKSKELLLILKERFDKIKDRQIIRNHRKEILQELDYAESLLEDCLNLNQEEIKKKKVEILDEKVKESVRQRLDEKHYYYVECWKDQINLLSKDVEISKEYILNKCDDETLYWLSEVYEEIIETTQSEELLEIIRERAKTVVNEKYRKDILQEADYAEGHLENYGID